MPGYEVIGKEERDAVNDVFDRGGVLSRYGWNEKRQNIFRVDKFEKAFASKFHVKYAQAVSSGTAALHATLKALGIEPGDEVITQSHTFVATVEAIIEARATPVITEINKTLNMDPTDLEAKITEKTKAIIPVHMLGVPAQMKEITSIAKQHGIPILEDCAQAVGGEYKGKKLGAIGNAGMLSFDFGKALTTGEGGMIITDDESIYLRSRAYSDHGHEYNPKLPRGEDTRKFSGFNYKMTELQGAIGLVQLKKLDYVVERQRENKRKIKEGIKDIPKIEFRELPDPKGDTGDTLAFFVQNRDKARKFAELLKEKGLGTKNLPDAVNWHFAGTWDHIFGQYTKYKGKQLSDLWKKSDEILRRAIAIPIFVNMSEDQMTNIIGNLQEISKRI